MIDDQMNETEKAENESVEKQASASSEGLASKVSVQSNEEPIQVETEVPADREESAPLVEVAPSYEDRPQKWYVVHTLSGHEQKVRSNLQKRIESMNMKEKIFNVLVPTEEEVEIKSGKKRIVQRKIFPGYVLVEMIMNDDSWYVVRNTSGVTGFVGSGTKPLPLPEEEVKQILKQTAGEAPKRRLTLKTGDKVRITSGPFTEFYGAVQEVNPEKEKIKVLVSIFGRETPVELEYNQVEKL